MTFFFGHRFIAQCFNAFTLASVVCQHTFIFSEAMKRSDDVNERKYVQLVVRKVRRRPIEPREQRRGRWDGGRRRDRCNG